MELLFGFEFEENDRVKVELGEVLQRRINKSYKKVREVEVDGDYKEFMVFSNQEVNGYQQKY